MVTVPNYVVGGDGVVNVDDLVAVIASWGHCGGLGGGWDEDGPTGNGGEGENPAAAAILACMAAADAQSLTGQAWTDAVAACICAELGLGCGN